MKWVARDNDGAVGQALDVNGTGPANMDVCELGVYRLSHLLEPTKPLDRRQSVVDHDIGVSSIELREGVEVGAADVTRPGFAEPVSALVPGGHVIVRSHRSSCIG